MRHEEFIVKLQIFDPIEIAEGSEEMDFRTLCDFDSGGGGVFWSMEGGPSPWEMHPDCDELLHAIDGEIEVEILPSSGGKASIAVVKAGSYLVVPRGCWHRQYFRTKSTEFYVTLGRTLHSQSEDPRADA